MPRRVILKEPKVQRGFGKGRRGPGRTQAEIDAKQMGVNRVVVVTPPHPNMAESARKQNAAKGIIPKDDHELWSDQREAKRMQRANQDLQRLIQDIGQEVVDPKTGWTRIVAVIRRLYAEAMLGRVPAISLLLERGWGKSVVPIQVDVRTELRRIVTESHLTPEDIESDPILRELFETVEGSVLDSQPIGFLSDGESVPAGSCASELVRSEPMSDTGDGDELLRSADMVEDGGRA